MMATGICGRGRSFDIEMGECVFAIPDCIKKATVAASLTAVTRGLEAGMIGGAIRYTSCKVMSDREKTDEQFRGYRDSVDRNPHPFDSTARRELDEYVNREFDTNLRQSEYHDDWSNVEGSATVDDNPDLSFDFEPKIN